MTFTALLLGASLGIGLGALGSLVLTWIFDWLMPVPPLPDGILLPEAVESLPLHMPSDETLAILRDTLTLGRRA